ncbi:MAG TPA: type II toxin-antitoxin system RelE/ParE family toxin [Planctomycetota bacterium]
MKVLPRAQQDIAEIYDFIANVQCQPLVAARWVDGIQATIESLSKRPTRGKMVPERAILCPDVELRQILFHHHRIIYTVKPGLVQVVHIRRGSRRGLARGDA